VRLAASSCSENSGLSAEKNSNGKEVKPMKYAKPEIVASGSAVEAIQGFAKTSPLIYTDMDPNSVHYLQANQASTVSAYEADE
jgi:hypothetical protein